MPFEVLTMGCVGAEVYRGGAADVVAELAVLDAELLVIVEQDLYPCAPEVPLPIAVSTREHLADRGLTGTRRPTLPGTATPPPSSPTPPSGPWSRAARSSPST
ncbi:hypothetical protein GA0115260_1065612 [Streptomyces sp. MnatMP-M27]|nr:hypothetical protein GA0115260_1065612 [Streptomyces sp. MnatMP-M27]